MGISAGRLPNPRSNCPMRPNGYSLDCGHDANCELGTLWRQGTIGQGNLMRVPQACPTRKTFTRKNPKGPTRHAEPWMPMGWNDPFDIMQIPVNPPVGPY
jgi:hypothetical protein